MAKSKIGGKKSKRISCSKRYKIEKKVRQHNKKLKKVKESKDKSKRFNKHKDPGIPNNCPFKEEILKEAETRRNLLEEEKKRRMEKRKKERSKLVDAKRNIGSLSSLVKMAEKKNAVFDKKQQILNEKNNENSNWKPLESSWKTYYKEVKKVIAASDVVIEVLDARDPLGSRCPQVEEAILNTTTRKKLILLINKIDLVPKENVEKWLKYLRNEFPTVAFKASTQSQASNLSRNKVPILTAVMNLSKSAACLGADCLMTLLGNYCRSLDIKTSITIGIVGFPNTGKSSVINSLKRSKACNVGSTPGVTKTMQVVQLDKHIKMLDSPGVVTTNRSAQESAILRNCVKLENIEDASSAVATILSRCTKEQMMLKYNIRQYTDVDDFLQILAHRMGQLKKGGLPDINKTAKQVLQDWNSGKITYYTEPPEKYERCVDVSSEILTQLSQAFDITAVASNEEAIFSGLKKSKQASDVILNSEGPVSIDMEGEDDEADSEGGEGMEVEDASIKVTMDISKTKTNKDDTAQDENMISFQMNKQRRNEFKKMKRQRKRADVLATNLSTALDKGLDSLTSNNADAYDFEQFFK